MFTGIIKHIGLVVSNMQEQDGKVLTVRILNVKQEIDIGDSISIDGCCLTVTKIDGDCFSFYVSKETLKQTILALLVKGQSVNTEPAMLASTPLGGHLVSGHIDEVARVTSVEFSQNTHKIYIELSPQGKKGVIRKGSITINGVSLTVMNINGKTIELNVIPHTWNNTNLCTVNDSTNNLVNVEFDQIVKIINKKIAEHFSNR
jgi:riboflavin synthase